MTKTYICANCMEEFEEDWTDEEAQEEFASNFPSHDIADAAIVCDDCYERLK